MIYEAVVINELIGASLSAARRLAQAVPNNPDFRSYFLEAAQEHNVLANSLKSAAREHGLDPIASPQAELPAQSLTIGELATHVTGVFSKALESDLSPAISELVGNHFDRVRSIYALLDSLPGESTIVIPPRGK